MRVGCPISPAFEAPRVCVCMWAAQQRCRCVCHGGISLFTSMAEQRCFQVQTALSDTVLLWAGLTGPCVVLSLLYCATVSEVVNRACAWLACWNAITRPICLLLSVPYETCVGLCCAPPGSMTAKRQLNATCVDCVCSSACQLVEM